MDYKYRATSVNLAFRIRLNRYLKGTYDRGTVHKKFKQELHLDEKLTEEQKFVFPENFLIITNEIEYLYLIRDQAIRQKFQQYKETQEALNEAIIELENSIKTDKALKAKEEQKLTDSREGLKEARTPDDKIAYQDSIHKTQAGIKNIEIRIARDEGELEEKIKTRDEENVREWRNQVELVEKAVEREILRYRKSVTRRIERKYGYTTFSHRKGAYEGEMVNIVAGEVLKGDK